MRSNLLRYRTYAPEVVALRDTVDRLMTESIGRFPQMAANGSATLTPTADAWESDNEVVIELALPGVQPGEVDITYEKDTLTVSGQVSPRADEHNWVLRERARGEFKRSFTLNVPIDAEAVEAKADNGILTLRLPKSEAAKPRKISVQSV